MIQSYDLRKAAMQANKTKMAEAETESVTVPEPSLIRGMLKNSNRYVWFANHSLHYHQFIWDLGTQRVVRELQVGEPICIVCRKYYYVYVNMNYKGTRGYLT